MAPSMFNIVALFLWTGEALAADCIPTTAKPIELPIKDVEVDSRIPGSFMTGLPAELGSPPQPLVLLPWAELNNTVRRGSYFRSSDSTTFRKTTNIVAAGGSAAEITTLGTELDVGRLVDSSFTGTDVFSVGDRLTVSVDSMPIGIPRLNWDHGFTTMHTLGLRSDSVFLKALVKAGKIPSHVWSFFWGRTQGLTQMDGSLVLGGYDRHKVIGSNYTQRLDYSEATGCWTGMKVTISGIEANFPNGKNVNVIDKDQPLSVCIVPHRQHLLEAPQSVVLAFLDATSMYDTDWSYGDGVQYGDVILDDEYPIFDGDITITINSQLPIRIPNDQYIITEPTFDNQGRRVDDEYDTKVLTISATSGNSKMPNGNNPYTLGRVFFTGAVLMVDHDAGTFTLWQANPLPDSDLVAVLDSNAVNCTDDADGSGAIGGPGENDSSSGNSVRQDSGDGSGRVNTGAIAGSVVGGVVGLGIIALAFFLIRRRRGRRRTEAQVAASATPEAAQPHKMVPIYPSEPELPNRKYTPPPMELSPDVSPGLRTPTFSISSDGHRMSGYTVYEMPGQVNSPPAYIIHSPYQTGRG